MGQSRSSRSRWWSEHRPERLAVLRIGPGPASDPVSPPAKQTAPSSKSSNARYFEFTSGSSNKFWEIGLDQDSFTVRFGRIGTPGQSQSKSFISETKAREEMEKLIADKLKKGYVEKAI